MLREWLCPARRRCATVASTSLCSTRRVRCLRSSCGWAYSTRCQPVAMPVTRARAWRFSPVEPLLVAPTAAAAVVAAAVAAEWATRRPSLDRAGQGCRCSWLGALGARLDQAALVGADGDLSVAKGLTAVRVGR